MLPTTSGWNSSCQRTRTNLPSAEVEWNARPELREEEANNHKKKELFATKNCSLAMGHESQRTFKRGTHAASPCNGTEEGGRGGQ